MLRTFIQISVALIFAALSIFAETVVHSSTINSFIKEQGLTLISALFALNLTSIVYILTRFKEMEKEYGIANFFKKSKKSIKENVNELSVALIVFYLVLALTPDFMWETPNPVLHKLKYETVCQEIPRLVSRFFTPDFWKCYPLILAVAARMCIFHSLVVTYDFLGAIITSSGDPETKKDK